MRWGQKISLMNRKWWGTKNDEDVEIVDEEDIEENDIVLQGDLREKASKHIDIDSDSSDDSTPCLTCGKIILNKFWKIHLKTHSKDVSLAIAVNIDESCPWEVMPQKLNLESIDFGEEESDLKIDGLNIEGTEHVLARTRNRHTSSLEKDQPDQTSADTLDSSVENEKTTQCKFCKKFMNKKSISRHIRTVHKSSERKILHQPNVAVSPTTSLKGENNSELLKKCKICLKNIKSSGFNRHLRRIHSGTSEKCKLCYLRFNRKDSFKRHIKTAHIKDKQLLNREIVRSECTFKCELCSLKFITKNVLEYHVERKHGRGDEQCKYCERRYPSQKRVKEHISKIHMKQFNTS